MSSVGDSVTLTGFGERDGQYKVLAITGGNMTSDPFAQQKQGLATESDPDELEFDLSEVKELSLHIPQGDYPAELVDVTKGQSQAGNPKYTWEYKIIGSKENGFRLWSHTALTKDALWKVQETTDALGFAKDAQGKSKFNKKQAIGRRVVLAVEDSEYQGEKRSQIGKVKRHPDGPVQEGGPSKEFDPAELG